jgi:3alpha(or 20beta)-hydroxysteroid dehydrogenase
MGRVSSKVAIVTGGSRGLGAEQARRLAEEGAKVVLTSGRSIEAGERLAAEIGDSACFMRHDVSRAEDWARVVEQTERRFGTVTVLVNNAGIVIPASLEAQTEAQFRQMFETNQLGTFLGMQAVIPSMRKAGANSPRRISGSMSCFRALSRRMRCGKPRPNAALP